MAFLMRTARSTDCQNAIYIYHLRHFFLLNGFLSIESLHRLEIKRNVPGLQQRGPKMAWCFSCFAVAVAGTIYRRRANTEVLGVLRSAKRESVGVEGHTKRLRAIKRNTNGLGRYNVLFIAPDSNAVKYLKSSAKY
jgi:hypothetical protein